MKVQNKLFINTSMALIISFTIPITLYGMIGCRIVTSYKSGNVGSFNNGNASNTIKGSGVPASKEIVCSEVNQIKVGGVGTLIITQDTKSPELLKIEADDNILPNIKTLIVNNVLEINSEDNVQPIVPLNYYINLKNLSNIDVSGIITVKLLEVLMVDALEITTSGNTNMTGTIVTEQLTVDASGNSKITLDGSASTQNIILSGSSSFEGTILEGKNATIKASGASKISVNVSDSINGKIGGASSLKYSGDPKINVGSSGASSIKKID